MTTIKDRLDEADAALTNLPEQNEGFDSAVAAARASINSARAQAIEDGVQDDEV